MRTVVSILYGKYENIDSNVHTFFKLKNNVYLFLFVTQQLL